MVADRDTPSFVALTLSSSKFGSELKVAFSANCGTNAAFDRRTSHEDGYREEYGYLKRGGARGFHGNWQLIKNP